MNNLPTSSKVEIRPTVVPEAYDLPKTYGDTKIVLLPRDPWWCFTYWEIGEQTKQEINKLYGENLNTVLRVYDVTNVDQFDGKNANKYFDIGLNIQATNWYINLPEVNRSWCVDIGIVLSDGRFIPLARSNIVIMPRFGVSPLTDAQWAVLQREFEKLLEMSGVQMIGKSSFDIAKLMKERWEELLAITQVSGMVSSGFVSSFKQRGEITVGPKEFFLIADTELVVYGETMPDAKLYIWGEEYKLSADGKFSIRLSLSEGDKEIPIRAISADGSMENQVIFNVTRKSIKK